jgi:acyl-CoA synthetase (AMP-forming)/AMP-acid ligase II
MTFTESQLETYCRVHLAGYKIPKKLLIVDSLPRVHGWKLLRRDLREKFSGAAQNPG